MSPKAEPGCTVLCNPRDLHALQYRAGSDVQLAAGGLGQRVVHAPVCSGMQWINDATQDLPHAADQAPVQISYLGLQ